MPATVPAGRLHYEVEITALQPNCELRAFVGWASEEFASTAALLKDWRGSLSTPCEQTVGLACGLAGAEAGLAALRLYGTVLPPVLAKGRR